MSWKLGFIFIQTRWTDSEAALLRELGFSDLSEPRKAHIADTLGLFPSITSVAVGDNYTMVLNDLLPYDLSYEKPFSAPLDERLKALSKIAPVLAGFMDGMTSTYAFCIFENGKVSRARKIVSARLETDFGKPYKEETKNKDDEEAKIFALADRWLNEPLDEFFFDPSFYMNTYDT